MNSETHKRKSDTKRGKRHAVEIDPRNQMILHTAECLGLSPRQIVLECLQAYASTLAPRVG